MLNKQILALQFFLLIISSCNSDVKLLKENLDSDSDNLISFVTDSLGNLKFEILKDFEGNVIHTLEYSMDTIKSSTGNNFFFEMNAIDNNSLDSLFYNFNFYFINPYKDSNYLANI